MIRKTFGRIAFMSSDEVFASTGVKTALTFWLLVVGVDVRR